MNNVSLYGFGLLLAAISLQTIGAEPTGQLPLAPGWVAASSSSAIPVLAASSAVSALSSSSAAAVPSASSPSSSSSSSPLVSTADFSDEESIDFNIRWLRDCTNSSPEDTNSLITISTELIAKKIVTMDLYTRLKGTLFLINNASKHLNIPTIYYQDHPEDPVMQAHAKKLNDLIYQKKLSPELQAQCAHASRELSELYRHMYSAAPTITWVAHHGLGTEDFKTMQKNIKKCRDWLNHWAKKRSFKS